MTGYRLSQQAAQDYREILAFTLNEWGVAQFEAYASLLDETFERLVRVDGEYGSIVVKLEMQEKANDFIQKLGGLSYIQENLQVESCDD
jgi:hypothetical protein